MSARIELQCRDGQHVATKQVVDFDTIKGLMTQSQTLQHNLAALAAAPDSANRESTRSTIDMAAEAARSLDSIVLQLWNTIPVTLRPTDASSSKAQEVFDIPELLEAILSELSMPDLLLAQQTSRVFRDTVNGSAKLKTLMGLQSVVDADFFSCLENRSAIRLGMPRFHMCVDRGVLTRLSGLWYEQPDDSVRIGLQIPAAGLRIGSRCRQMLVCQPPPKYATLTYTEYDKQLPDKSTIVLSEKGLTVGDLQDAVVAFCATKSVQEERGDNIKGLFGDRLARQSCRVTLEVELKNSDPIAKQRRAKREAGQEQ